MGTVFHQELSSDAIHNRNCYDYFHQLTLNHLINERIVELLPDINSLPQHLDEYNEYIAYGDWYSFVMASLEAIIETGRTFTSAQTIALDNLIEAIYHNNNHILDAESAGWINSIAAQTRPQKTNTSEQIVKKLKNHEKTINQRSPNDTESTLSRLYSVVAPNFKPQFGTNIPTIKNYSYKTEFDPIEYRFSTQAQRHEGHPRVSPLFIRWLQIQAKKSPTDSTITHIYFNNLGYDRTELDIAGIKERKLSDELHKLEDDPSLKVMVITLPAHQGLMNRDDYKITDDKLSYSSVFDELLAVGQGKPHKSGITDFFISLKSRKLLFNNPVNEEKILRNLLTESFKAQGIEAGTSLSTAQKQAVWMHFIKFKLTNYIITTIKPQSYNFSCKDAIDRGAVSSTYFNLIKSFSTQFPMQREVFELSLDAAAATVKGRGMNFHRTIIWNALDSYVNANYEQLINNPNKSWLIYWRDMNCPHKRVNQLISIRLEQSIKQFDSLSEEMEQIKTIGKQLLISIQNLYSKDVTGKRLFLEAISRTCELISNPSEELTKHYKKLSHELKINYPALMLIGGIMEILLGALLFIPTFSYSMTLIDHGVSKSKSGFFAPQRNKLSDEMLDFVTNEFDIPVFY